MSEGKVKVELFTEQVSQIVFLNFELNEAGIISKCFFPPHLTICCSCRIYVYFKTLKLLLSTCLHVNALKLNWGAEKTLCYPCANSGQYRVTFWPINNFRKTFY